MTAKQKQIFKKFISTVFPEAEFAEIPEKEKHFENRKSGIRKEWSTEEMALLVSYKSTPEICKELKRSEMSVILARGQVFSEYRAWRSKNDPKGEMENEENFKKFLAQRSS